MGGGTARISPPRGSAAAKGGRTTFSVPRSCRMELLAHLLALLLFLLHLVSQVSGEVLRQIVGDPVRFPDKCVPGEPGELKYVKPDGVLLVAEREHNVCRQDDDYKDRMDESSCFAFSRSVFSDVGQYELNCGAKTYPFYLDVVFAPEVSVTEGEPFKVPCYKVYARQQVDSMRWEKRGGVVVSHSLVTGQTTYGSGFEGNVRLAPDGVKDGNWSLIFPRARLDDEGDYFCSFFKGGVREEGGDPAAVRVKVTKRGQDRETRCPSQGATARNGDTDGRWMPSLYFLWGLIVFLLLS